jgi:Tol biopolymer transport system component
MTSQDTVAAGLLAWFDSEAQAPIPAAALGRALSVTAGRRPRAARLATLGSHRIGTMSPGAATYRVGRLELPSLHSRLAIPLVILLLLLLAAGVLLVGSRLTEQPPGAGSLVYALDGDIYLADADGAHPIRVADGVPEAPSPSPGGPCDRPSGSYLLGDGPVWAPDGRHFLFFDLTLPPDDGLPGLCGYPGTAHIADAEGRVVASVPGIGIDATWSPDSSRLAAWAWIAGVGSNQVGVYGLDGALQTSIPLEPGYARYGQHGVVWAPDGRSVWARIAPGADPELWQLPIDGSTPRRLSQDDRMTGLSDFSPDGSKLAAIVPGGSLVVAKADGSQLRTVVQGNGLGSVVGGVGGPVWSPTGTQVAYDWAVGAGTADIRIVDVPDGTYRTLVPGVPTNGSPLGWSPGGDRILFSRLDQQDRPSLWSVAADGGAPTLVVDGASSGAWRPAPVPATSLPLPSATPSAPATAAPPTMQPALHESNNGPQISGGPLRPATYWYGDDLTGETAFNVSFTVPAGWTWNGRYLSKGSADPPGGAAIFFFEGPVQVYDYPCHWAGALPNPPTGPSAGDLMAALAAQPLRNATAPIDRLLIAPGASSGWSGKSIELTVPDDADFAACDGGQFRTWGPDDEVRTAQGPGQRDFVWAVDVGPEGFNAQRLIIDVASFPGTPADVMAEVDAILGSFHVCHCG